MDQKRIGYLLVVIGALTFLYAIAIFDTTVAVDAYNRVHNFGLLREQENMIWLSGAIAGAGFLVILNSSKKVSLGGLLGTSADEDRVRCPDCAELVLREALVCKHCGCRITPPKASRNGSEHQEEVLENNQAGLITIHGYKEHFVFVPKIKIYKDGDYIGEIGHHETMKVTCEIDCVLSFKAMGRNRSLEIKRDQHSHVLLQFNRFTGGIFATAASNAELPEKKELLVANAKNNNLLVFILMMGLLVTLWWSIRY